MVNGLWVGELAHRGFYKNPVSYTYLLIAKSVVKVVVL